MEIFGRKEDISEASVGLTIKLEKNSALSQRNRSVEKLAQRTMDYLVKTRGVDPRRVSIQDHSVHRASDVTADQLIHDVALQNLDVTFALDRAGLVGADGATHAGNYDVSYLRCIPNMAVMAPVHPHGHRTPVLRTMPPLTASTSSMVLG